MRAIAGEVVGLFVDDGALALGLVAWCAVLAVVSHARTATLGGRRAACLRSAARSSCSATCGFARGAAPGERPIRRFGVADRVSCPQNRVDQRWPKSWSNLAAKPMHMHVDDVAARLEIVVPDAFEQHRPGHDLPGMPHQQLEQLELAMLQLDRPARTAVRARVEFEVGDPQHRIAARAIGPAPERLDPRQHLGEGIRLGQVVVAPGLKPSIRSGVVAIALSIRIGRVLACCRS